MENKILNIYATILKNSVKYHPKQSAYSIAVLTLFEQAIFERRQPNKDGWLFIGNIDEAFQKVLKGDIIERKPYLELENIINPKIQYQWINVNSELNCLSWKITNQPILE